MILLYNKYIQFTTDKPYDYSKMHLSMLLLFKVPENHPTEDIKFFGGWIMSPKRQRTDTTNLLLPLGYENNRLTIKAIQIGYLGPNYDVAGEYEYFKARFPFRHISELN